MGRKALFAAICWLAISEAFGDKSTVIGALDNDSAESAPRLYRNVPTGIYASAVPYGSYSFHMPRFMAAPHTAASQVVAVKQQAANNGFLKDSYGNRFVETPLSLGYKTAFPQEFLPLQKLPDHLAQPLVGASANFQFKQTGPQVFVGSPYRVAALQGPTPTPINQFGGYSQPLVYADKIKSLSPNSLNPFGSPTAQQQSSNNKAIFANAQPYDHFAGYKSEPKFQRIQDIPRIVYGEPQYQRIQEISKLHHGDNKFQRLKESPTVHREEHQFERYEEVPHHEQNQQESHSDSAPLQAVPAKKTVTYVTDVNGKTTVVKLKTDPPVPLLDLTLLEPLTFDNPLVPQVQHFLPRIHQATYKKLPGIKNYEKEIVVQNSMSYDSGNRKGKAKAPKKSKKPKNSKPKHNIAPKTPVSHHETLDEVPEVSYEINQPNYKETYKEKALTYNKETTTPPVSYSYDTKMEKEPVTYSYSRSSQDPQNEEIRYESPDHLVYTLSPEEQSEEEEENSYPSEEESESQRHSSREIDDSGPYPQHADYKDQQRNNESPKPSKQHQEIQNDEKEHHPRHEQQHHPKHEQQHQRQYQQDQEQHHPQQQQHHPQQQQHQRQQQETPRDVEVFNSEKNYPPPNQQPVQQYEQFQPITREYEEDIRLLPTPSASIKIDPNQHVQHAKPTSEPYPHPSPSPHHDHREEHSSSERHPSPSSAPQQHSYQHSSPHPSPGPNTYQHYSAPQSEHHNAPAPHIHEKSKRIIIKEETPEGINMLTEKMKEEMIKREENSEEDFEKAYEDAAIGFPSYSRPVENPEKDIYNPASYGVPPEHIEYNIEDTPFQQYQDQTDDYPKTTRLSYKDARDKTKENYYADYEVSKPESLNNRYKNKEGYYKLYRDNKPDYLVDEDKNKQKQKSAKYTAAPSHDYPTQQAPKSYYGSFKPTQKVYQYTQVSPRDNSAFASRPHQIYKIKTNFVEPQFQYGFEPVSIPKLLDSELSAMASNLRPESEKPGMMKKIYKENWYIKQTSTSAGGPAS